MSDFHLSSPEFDDGHRIPREYGRDASDINPPLHIEGVPDGTDSMALLMEDPDARAVAGKVWTHWIVYAIEPDRRSIPADWQPETASEGRNDFDEIGYGGPAPPDGEHTYVFRIYALVDMPELFQAPTSEDIQRSIGDRVLADADLRGSYPASWVGG